MRLPRSVPLRVLLVVGCLVPAVGCAKQAPQEVADLNRLWGETRDGCASVYLADDVQGMEPGVDSMNGLVADEKYRKAGKEAVALMPQVEDLSARAAQARAAAKKEAEASVTRAEEAMAEAMKVEAAQYAASDYEAARGKLDRAKRELQDPCGYHRARDLADDATRQARQSVTIAAAEKKRVEEERRRAEEEARRLAEERRLREKPPSYTIRNGDCLWTIAAMEKVYGDPLLWPLLYEANSGRISDPHLIYPDGEITIPRDIPEGELESRARRYYNTRSAE